MKRTAITDDPMTTPFITLKCRAKKLTPRRRSSVCSTFDQHGPDVNIFFPHVKIMPKQTQSEKVDAILKQFNGLGFQSKQLVFLIMLGDLRSNIPRSNPARKLLNEIAGMTPKNKEVFKKNLISRRQVQNTPPVRKSSPKARSPPTPLSGSRRKRPNTVPGAVNMTNLPKWYYGPHYRRS